MGTGVNKIQALWRNNNTLLLSTATEWNSATTFSASGGTMTRSGTTETVYLHTKVTDNAGNTTVSVSGAYILNNTPPSVTGITIVPGTTAWTNANVSITIVGWTGEMTIRQYKIGTGGAWTNYTSTFTVSENTTIYVRAADSIGNYSGDSAVSKEIANIDKSNPAITLTPNSQSPAQKGITVNISASDTASRVNTVEVLWRSNNTALSASATEWNTATNITLSGTNITNPRTGSITRPGTTTETVYLHTRTTDVAGNALVFVSGAYLLKSNTAPVFSGNPITNTITVTGAIISATATDADGDTISYDFYVGTTAQNATLRGTVPDKASGTSATYNVTGLSGNTTYSYYVVAYDAYGGTVTSNTGTFKTTQLTLSNLISNGNFATNITDWTGSPTATRTTTIPAGLPTGITATAIAQLGQSNLNGTPTLTHTQITGLTTGRKYYLRAYVRIGNTNSTGCQWMNNTTALSPAISTSLTQNNWVLLDGIWTSSGTTFTPRLSYTSGSGNNAKLCYAANVMMIDLTGAYGAGNEPDITIIRQIVNDAGGYFTTHTP